MNENMIQNELLEETTTVMDAVNDNADLTMLDMAADPVSTSNVASGIMIGFAGVGVVATAAAAGFGIYKLVKFIKKKTSESKAAAAASESLAEELIDDVEE